MQKKKIRFMALLMVLGLVPMLLSLLISSISNLNTLTSEVEKGVYEKLDVAATNVVEFFVWDINEDCLELDDYSFIDSELGNNIQLTLCKGDERIITSIKKPDGDRDIGSKISNEIYLKVRSGETVLKDKVQIDGNDYYACYKPLFVNGEFWGVGFAGTPEESVVAMKNQLQKRMVIMSLTIMAIFAALIVFMAIYLKRSMEEAVDSIQKLSKGVISEVVEIESPIVELNEIAGSLSELQTSLHTTVTGVKEAAGVLSAAIVEVDTLTESNATGVGQISDAVSELATTAQSMAESVENTASQTVRMGNNIEDIIENVRTLHESTETIQSANSDAKQYMNTVLSSSDKSVIAVRSISEQINATNNAIGKINNAVDIILGIADQTKLLALNASIEAARAGDAGKGFAVVADEISALSQQSAQGAQTIKDIADEMVSMSGQTVTQAELISSIIEEEKGFISDTQSKFLVLGDSVEQSISQIDSIRGMTESLQVVKEQISSNVTDLSAISEENAASNEEVTASCSEIASGVSDTRAKSEEMSAIASNLIELMSFFK